MMEPTPTAPASGLVYADVPNRVIAFIIDAIVIAVIMVFVTIILGAIGLAAGMFGSGSGTFAGSIVYAIVSTLIGAAYFIYTWTSMRATVGMRALGMQIGNAADGATLTQDQAIRRYLALAAPGIVGSALSGLPVIGWLLSLVSLAWVIYLLYTTAQSPTKQGFHDVFAQTMVVKAARNVG
ncbi:MAG TPA: RDD family protein [Candidatus Limnocylindrales bacterium]|jgi:uncharacterized RDD family membrane protein YckC|nr:RDD family protein [Candidatus Limnocylindrales bacterium]